MSLRETKSFDDNESIDIEELTVSSFTKKTSSDEKELIEAIAKENSFSSRGDNIKKPRKRSPYVIQKNIKMRVGMSELLTKVTKKISADSDQETLEIALLALIQKVNNSKLEKEYRKIIDS